MFVTSHFQITPEVLNLLSELDEFKGAWRAYGKLAPDRLAMLRQVATIESVGSSTRIEGSVLSDREVEQLLRQVESQQFSDRHEQEVAGYAAVMDTISSSWEEISLTENHIKQLHRDLLRYSAKDGRHRGNYKSLPNDIAAFDAQVNMMGVVFATASPFDTPMRMSELVLWYNDVCDSGAMHPLLRIAIFIVVFLEIHPFQDGNGRLSRVLTTLLLLQAGYVYVPYVSLEAVIEQSKDRYYLALRQTQQTIRNDLPNWHPWVLFFLGALQQQKRRLETKIKREQVKLMDLHPLAVIALDYVREHGRVTNKDVVQQADASPNTVKKILGQLVEQGLLLRHGGGRSIWYSLG